MSGVANQKIPLVIEHLVDLIKLDSNTKNMCPYKIPQHTKIQLVYFDHQNVNCIEQFLLVLCFYQVIETQYLSSHIFLGLFSDTLCSWCFKFASRYFQAAQQITAFGCPSLTTNPHEA